MQDTKQKDKIKKESDFKWNTKHTIMLRDSATYTMEETCFA
jgi:hypothetical protein